MKNLIMFIIVVITVLGFSSCDSHIPATEFRPVVGYQEGLLNFNKDTTKWSERSWSEYLENSVYDYAQVLAHDPSLRNPHERILIQVDNIHYYFQVVGGNAIPVAAYNTDPIYQISPSAFFWCFVILGGVGALFVIGIIINRIGDWRIDALAEKSRLLQKKNEAESLRNEGIQQEAKLTEQRNRKLELEITSDKELVASQAAKITELQTEIINLLKKV